MDDLLHHFQQAKELIDAAQNVVIISHRNPDADAIGSNLALREALEMQGKHVISASVDVTPEDCDFLVQELPFSQEFVLEKQDLVITVDCGGHKLVAFHERIPNFFQSKPIINIDHHPSNDFFGTVNIVAPHYSSTCFIVAQMLFALNWPVTPRMATALLHGLYYDTGSFMHSNTDSHSLRTAGRLKALGGDHERCVKKQFHTSSIEKLRLWGRALEHAIMTPKQILVTTFTHEDYTAAGSEYSDISGFINYFNQVPEAKFCVVLAEDAQGNIKGSMRTQREEVDLTQISGLFGGGGHKKASGFTLPGRLRERRLWTIERSAQSVH